MHTKSISEPPPAGADLWAAHPPATHCFLPDSLQNFLLSQGNDPRDIAKAESILHMDRLILEIGCGRGDISLEIARRNPETGVIATDLYDWQGTENCGSTYGRTARLWKERRLHSQQQATHNLVLLRADFSVLRCLPQAAVDTLLLINPEPNVGRALMELLKDPTVYGVLKPGDKQVVVLPFSRELGVCCCGGCEFDHGQDWSRGLGFMMDSGLNFRRGDAVQWGVNLARSSPYSPSSTQHDVYVLGCSPSREKRRAKRNGIVSALKFLTTGARRPLGDK